MLSPFKIVTLSIAYNFTSSGTVKFSRKTVKLLGAKTTMGTKKVSNGSKGYRGKVATRPKLVISIVIGGLLCVIIEPTLI